jgi:hypothetical protein
MVDDWAMAPLVDAERRDFLEICNDRYQRANESARSSAIFETSPPVHAHNSTTEIFLN